MTAEFLRAGADARQYFLTVRAGRCRHLAESAAHASCGNVCSKICWPLFTGKVWLLQPMNNAKLRLICGVTVDYCARGDNTRAISNHHNSPPAALTASPEAWPASSGWYRDLFILIMRRWPCTSAGCSRLPAGQSWRRRPCAPMRAARVNGRRGHLRRRRHDARRPPTTLARPMPSRWPSYPMMTNTPAGFLELDRRRPPARLSTTTW